MTFQDLYRLSSHAVITHPEDPPIDPSDPHNTAPRILQIRATYGARAWGIPGGALDQGETIHQALYRECLEELGWAATIVHLSGVYFHSRYQSHACVFRCTLPDEAYTNIKLSSEHDAWRWFALRDLTPVQAQRVLDCLLFSGEVRSAAF